MSVKDDKVNCARLLLRTRFVLCAHAWREQGEEKKNRPLTQYYEQKKVRKIRMQQRKWKKNHAQKSKTYEANY